MSNSEILGCDRDFRNELTFEVHCLNFIEVPSPQPGNYVQISYAFCLFTQKGIAEESLLVVNGVLAYSI